MAELGVADSASVEALAPVVAPIRQPASGNGNGDGSQAELDAVS
jgi:hypothetical protein